MAETIGIIGVGGIGLAIAGRLMQGGYAVAGYRRSPMEDFVAAGGIAAESPADVARRASVVWTSLPGAPALDAVLGGETGLLAALGPGHVVIETTTMTPADKRAHAARIAAAGAAMLDCPVSGTPGMIGMGRGAFFASGRRETVEAVRPVMEAVGKVTRVGDIGAGAAAKSVATMLVAIHNLAAAEALAFAAREGADLESLHAAIAGSPASSAMFELRGALMAKRDYSGGSGSIEGFSRGLGAVADELDDDDTSPLLRATCAAYMAAVDAGHTGRDQASIFEYLMGAAPA